MGDKPSGLGVKPEKLTPMKIEEVKASAQRIFDQRGRPPYGNESVPLHANRDGLAMHPFYHLSADELRVISEFVQFWLPFLIEKPKVKQPQVGKGQEGIE